MLTDTIINTCWQIILYYIIILVHSIKRDFSFITSRKYTVCSKVPALPTYFPLQSCASKHTYKVDVSPLPDVSLLSVI